ncbi:tetratricopeptide repeat protein [Acidovorax sp. LjRoot117]|uniref:tetratricopeptide repeat protein n=1 Tax=Acidovorax sp. LjRoot117 TaxID=3342255 RepID=UPI003ED05442
MTMPFVGGRWSKESVFTLLVILAISGVGSALYGPYLQNPFVFDDGNLFFSSRLTTAAIEPWELVTRSLPYFTLGWVQTQYGRMEAHRLISLVLHILVAWQLYRLIKQMLILDMNRAVPIVAARHQACAVAAGLAVIFIVHPVAVYAAGYLIQRTTVMATLFSLVSLRYLLTALQEGSLVMAMRSALMSSLAMLCKEHSVTVPFAALSLVLLLDRIDRRTVYICAAFVCANLPAVALVLSVGIGFVGQPYEPKLSDLQGEIYGIPVFKGRWDRWLFSAYTQAQLYFQYWVQWLVPSTTRMSVDLRVDFLEPWTPLRAWLQLAVFAAIPSGAIALSLLTGKYRLFTFGLAFSALLFMVEFSLVRFQEPYVLYRSYIWAIGYAATIAALARHLARRWIFAVAVVAIPLLFVQSQDRLESFSSRAALWEDAAAKLPTNAVAGASRIFFNRGNERFQTGDVEGALSDIGKAIELSPKNSSFYIARASTLTRAGRAGDAIHDLDSAERLSPDEAPRIWFERFRALHALNHPEAEQALQNAARLGSFPARYFIEKRRSNGADVKVFIEGTR